MELLDVVDINGNPTGETVAREVAHREGKRHRTAHVWILKKNDNKIEILLQKRASDKDSFPGCYDISSAGHVPAGVDYVPSAIRELKEELDLEVEENQLIDLGLYKKDTFDVFYGEQYVDRQVSHVYIVWLDKDAKDFKLQKEELEGILWLEMDECIDAVINNKIKHCIDIEELNLIKAYLLQNM
ncbi:NUDIX hydrolase [Lachnobacterium bovis]|uniref:Isopentenyldiphosphate isomerase n=1 Tax=Lachnobacterium bovis TaxID=140626 RepID=A0A1H9S9Z0_9FIRM|nr:NUDIX domain-containing protein [Lachnobacterium bovis]SER81761.1 Isopentenyldiphosphate isomerase [Lachnobacterium bovis]